MSAARAWNQNMNWNSWKSRFSPAERTATAGFVLPSVVIEVEPDFVAGARVEVSRRQVRRMEVAELEPGALNPHPGRANVANEAALRRAVQAVTQAVGNGSGHTGLLVSDGAVRGAVLPFDAVPADHAELESLVWWRLKEHVPFSPEEARLTYQVSKREGGGFEVLALAASSAVLGEYESALRGMSGGLILPATVALLPLLPEDGGSGQLLVSVCSGWITTVVVAGTRVCSWRTREMLEVEPREQAKAVATEAGRVVASAGDHLKVDIGQVWLCARPPATLELAAEVRHAVSRQIQLLRPASEVGGALPVAERKTFERFGAPLAGLLANAG
jgi:hypothetical protein